MKVILSVIAGVCVAIAGVTMGLIYTASVVGVPNEPTPFKKFLEYYGLNLLGDSLAGIMALVTLLVVIASLAFQMQSANQTVKEMKEQNNVAKAVARANYKLALLDKRLEVYNDLNEAAVQVSKGQLEEDFHRKSLKAIRAASHLFSDDNAIVTWIKDLAKATTAHRSSEISINTALQTINNGEGQFQAETDLNNAIIKREESFKMMADVYDWDKLDELLLPYLNLESDILKDVG